MPTDRRRELLVRALAAVPDGPMPQRLCTAALHLLGVSGAAVASAPPSSEVLVEAGTLAAAGVDLEFRLGEGPSRESLAARRPVAVPDLAATDGRWPAYQPAAIELGVVAVFAFPITVGGADLGVASFVRDAPGPLADAQHEQALLLADLFALLLIDDRAGIRPLSYRPLNDDDWDARSVVHQATGMVAVQLGVGLGDALARLRATAFVQARPLDDVARDVVGRRLRFEE